MPSLQQKKKHICTVSIRVLMINLLASLEFQSTIILVRFRRIRESCMPTFEIPPFCWIEKLNRIISKLLRSGLGRPWWTRKTCSSEWWKQMEQIGVLIWNITRPMLFCMIVTNITLCYWTYGETNGFDRSWSSNVQV